jgi:hypothetical protein
MTVRVLVLVGRYFIAVITVLDNDCENHRNWRGNASVAFLFSSEPPEACRRSANQNTRNCLRNSYAIYAQTFRSLGDVAKAMGDQEVTVKRYYIETLEPNVGHEWFKVNL